MADDAGINLADIVQVALEVVEPLRATQDVRDERLSLFPKRITCDRYASCRRFKLRPNAVAAWIQDDCADGNFYDSRRVFARLPREPDTLRVRLLLGSFQRRGDDLGPGLFSYCHGFPP